MASPIPNIPTINPISFPELKLIGTDSVAAQPKTQSLQEWAMAGGGVPVSHRGREDHWHSKVRKMAAGGEVFNTVPDLSDRGEIIQGPAYAKGGAVHMQKGGKMGVGMKIADIVSDVSKQADEILAAKKAASKLEDAMKSKQAPWPSCLTKHQSSATSVADCHR